MTQPTYSYGANTHDDAATAITNADNAIRQELDQCNAMAMQYLDSWSAKSRDQYNAHKANWDKAFLQMQDILKKAAPTLMNCHNEYEAHDRAVKASFA